MQLTGTYRFKSSRDTVWAAMLSPDAIEHCMPGCESFRTMSEDQYEAKMRAGIGAIRGTFTGKISLLERRRPESYRMSVDGGGGPGRIKGSGVISLHEDGDHTVVTYEGDAQVAGLIASVGQRLLAVSAKHLIEQFFKCMERQVGTQDSAAHT